MESIKRFAEEIAKIVINIDKKEAERLFLNTCEKHSTELQLDEDIVRVEIYRIPR